MDLSLSLQTCAIEELARNGRQLAAGVHPISSEVENAISTERLTGSGVAIEPMTAELADALARW